jgi:uncharacterized damage-inducible protein DinB
MNARDVLKTALTSTQNLLGMYVSDLSDADLLVRPVPSANHIAWQLGHLCLAERMLAAGQGFATSYPELPAGFTEQHAKEKSTLEPPKGFGSKAEYLDLFNKSRAATLDLVSKLTDADLDKPTTGNMAKFAPTLGALLMLVSNHTLMHAGQITVVRRKLGKPVLF